MKSRSAACILLFSSSILLAQTTATASQLHTNDLGFSYSLPSDWQVVDATPSLPVVKQQADQNATSQEEKRGVACVQIALTARHGDPASVVVVVDLPFDCFGQTMADKDLPGFAGGAAEGIKQSFDISEPIYGSYRLGTHSVWIERAKGTPKGHPESPYTVEIVCSLLKKGAVCWMAMAADPGALQIFESGSVALEDEPASALVPATAFDKKPS